MISRHKHYNKIWRIWKLILISLTAKRIDVIFHRLNMPIKKCISRSVVGSCYRVLMVIK